MAAERRSGLERRSALKADFEALLGAFQEAETVRFEDFASLWRQRRFHALFYGKIRALEQKKLTQDALALACPYFLPPCSFQIRVGALYLLYGLYNVQLCQPKQKIRVALKDWPEVMRFQQELLSAQHYDAAYIFRKLRMDRAFYFTAMPTLLSFKTERTPRDKVETKKEFKDPSDRVATLITDGVLDEFENVHKHYWKMKCQISMDQSQPDKALSLIKDDFVDRLKNIVLEHQQWQKDKLELPSTSGTKEAAIENEGSSQEWEGFGRAQALASIKAKSYSSVVQVSKSRRHRQVKLESSASRSDHGITKRNVTKLEPLGKSQLKATPQAEEKSGAVRPLSMPVIAEAEAEESDDDEETDHSSDEATLQAEEKSGAFRPLSMPVIAEDEAEDCDDDDDDDDEETDHSSDEDFIPGKKKRML